MISRRKDTMFIGKKSLITYFTSTIIQLATIPLVAIKERRLSMGHAVGVVQIMLRKTNPSFMVEDIQIGSESLVSVDAKNRNISTIEIPIKRVSSIRQFT
ncbi:MAG: DNA-binding protein [Nitrosopumilus sp.]|nr:DNA-binding protein [Nitrosopumilus sp.]MDH3735421.1 DNA-binding protein [Nitrosopumilus sp.]MDH3823266.1 DNA-binding protein [Nitrosopumilus sp.]MDH3832545.1 DNA-binding protein [Nitrosopumilus sp.]